ncbi:MAG: DNA gyrase subunit A, partial [Myxococcota bacterium]
AVGMATNIPPHNIGETVDALILLARNPRTTLDEIMEKLPGPDFPTGALICGAGPIREAYRTGRGLLTVRARAEIEAAKGGKQRIVVDEIPYKVNKASMIEKIAELVRDGRIDGISDVRDESDRRGMRVVVELKKDADDQVVLNQLFKLTPMQITFGVNMVALVRNRPQTLGLIPLLQHFLDFRREVVRRRAAYDLRQAEARAHILEGFAIALDNLDAVIVLIRASQSPAEARAHILEGFEIALDNLDAVIALIRASGSPAEARAGLESSFQLSERQAQAILELRLQRLTAMERQKILDELAEVRALIEELKALLASDQLVTEKIVEELVEIRAKYADPRRTELAAPVEDFTTEDLIAEEDMVVTITHRGYAKRHVPRLYRAQRRGGKGKVAASTADEDFVEQVIVASTHAYLLCFTNLGRVYWLKVFELPELSRAAKGKALVNLLRLGEGERIQAILPVRDFDEGGFVVLATRQGTIKKTELAAFSNPRPSGIIAIHISEGDELIAAARTTGSEQLLLATQDGKSIRFPEAQVRPMGRSATGVRGISTREGDATVGMEVLKPGKTILTVSENGFGKRTPLDDYREQNRGGQGIITIKTTERNGQVVGILQVSDGDEIMLITNGGKMIRTRVAEIPTMSRNTQGVRLMEPSEGEVVVSVAKLAEDVEVDDGEPGGEAP